MSTIRMGGAIARVLDALFFDIYGERKYIPAINPSTLKSTVDELRDSAYEWANRVYIANQIAYIFDYHHREGLNREIVMLNRLEATGGGYLITRPEDFFGLLRDIKYNIYSSGGQVVLCREDMDILNALIEIAASATIFNFKH